MQIAGAPEPSPCSAAGIMASETRLRRGVVPSRLDDQTLQPGRYLLSSEAFLLRSKSGIGLMYRKGEGITIEQPECADEREVALWLNGMLYSAIAAINGLLPFHASAVAHNGHVYGFSGASGAGKSTLAAALSRYGMQLFCDDTLVLDLSGDGTITCLPGHKRLKLWPEGLRLAGAREREQVAAHYPKIFADPVAGTVAKPLPLAAMIFLEVGPAPQILSVPAGERIARLQDEHYTCKIFEQVGNLTRVQRFKQLAQIAARMPMHRFSRPFAAEQFEESLAVIAKYICSESSS